MIELKPDECRVLGVIIEKALTTPAQYPLTLNAITTGCNQKSNRDPVLNFDEDRTQRALDGLRSKRLVTEVHMSGSRVLKYRHECKETLETRVPELAVIAELLLRGPQTVGELRSRAGRMFTMESIEVVQNILSVLMDREPPFIQRIAPAPGSRAVRFAQLFCSDLHPIDGGGVAVVDDNGESSNLQDPDLRQRVKALEDEVASLRGLEQQVADLKAYLGKLAESLGEEGPA